MIKKSVLVLSLLGMSMGVCAQQAETLDRGVVAVKTDNGVFVSWRSLADDSKSTTFDVYRDGVKVNAEPVKGGTNLLDAEGTATSKYVVKRLDKDESSKETTPWGDPYLRIKLDRPAGGTIEGNNKFTTYKNGAVVNLVEDDYTYSPNDCSVGDVDGDGEYEIFVKWDPSNSQDNSLKAYTSNVYIDCYKLDGTKLWRVDLGRNIRAGAHYTQFMVYDFDGDGKAELMCKTAPGTIDGKGKAVLMGDDKVTDDYRNSDGIVIKGPEYLTVFNGLTGEEITTTSYVPLRTVQSSWGDSYGNRCERYLACVAYLDGKKPSAVFCRGYYTHSYLCAWDFDGKELKQRWLHASTTKGQGAYGEGAHSLTVGDVDGDGCDEIVYGSACIDHDGNLLYRTGAGHGDALHLGDFDPDREGLEVFMVHEEKSSAYKWDCEFRDAATGEIIWGEAQSGNDIGRGLVGDLSENWRGYEVWPGSRFVKGNRVNATFDCKGNVAADGKVPSSCFRIYWDGDLLDELFDGKYNKDSKKSFPVIEKRNSALTSSSTLMSFNKWNAQSCNTTKATPCLTADILGDWREEIILWDGENSSDLLLFTTTIPSEYRVPCLMQDHNYRMAIAWQNVAYNQPPHLGYYLADRFSNSPRLTIKSGSVKQLIEVGDPIQDITGQAIATNTLVANGMPDGVTLDFNDNTGVFTISGTPTEIGTYDVTLVAAGEENAETRLELTINVVAKVNLVPLARYRFETLGETTPNEIEGEATVTGSSATLVKGVEGNALSLAGGTYLKQKAYDKIQLGDRDFTIELWFKSTTSAAYMLHKGSLGANSSTGATGNWVGIEYKNGNLRFAIDDDKQKSEASAAASECFDGTWHHVVCVRDGMTKQLKLYIDGALAGDAADNTGAIADNNEDFVIGNVNVNFDNPFKGEIDELYVYEGAMSAAKVAQRYEESKPEAAGIDDALVNANITEGDVTLIDAATGIVVATGHGTPGVVTENAAPGVYVLVIDNGTDRQTIKFIKH